ncbi:MAG: hypothetical protein IJ217_02260 [Clostridia bacterium]|nr:hypothetical protein [Clostridia bacterium]
MEKIKEWIGAIIGVIVGILFVVFGLWYPALVIGIIVGFAYLGNYAQKNKGELKEKLKNFIDKI